MNKKSFAGGLCIGIAALANMLAPHPVVGAFLFCFGLFVILANNFKLCTGMFGSCKTKEEWIDSLFTLSGNILGAICMGLIVYACNWDIPEIILYDNNLWSVFLKSLLCGAMIHLGVKSYKNNHPFVMALSVMIFVLCGMEHCVANAFLFGFCEEQPNLLLSYNINILGNIVGAKVINWLMS